MSETVPVELLYTALGLCAVLAGILADQLRREKKKNGSHGHNPGNQQRVMDKLDGLQEHMARMETKMDDAVHVLIELRTILVRRRGE